MTLGARNSSTTVVMTFAPLMMGVPMVTAPSLAIISTSAKVWVAPASTGSRSTSMVLPSTQRNCRAPERMMAYFISCLQSSLHRRRPGPERAASRSSTTGHGEDWFSGAISPNGNVPQPKLGQRTEIITAVMVFCQTGPGGRRGQQLLGCRGAQRGVSLNAASVYLPAGGEAHDQTNPGHRRQNCTGAGPVGLRAAGHFSGRQSPGLGSCGIDRLACLARYQYRLVCVEQPTEIVMPRPETGVLPGVHLRYLAARSKHLRRTRSADQPPRHGCFAPTNKHQRERLIWLDPGIEGRDMVECRDIWPPSSSGPGRGPLKAKTGVRIPAGALAQARARSYQAGAFFSPAAGRLVDDLHTFPKGNVALDLVRFLLRHGVVPGRVFIGPAVD